MNAIELLLSGRLTNDDQRSTPVCDASKADHERRQFVHSVAVFRTGSFGMVLWDPRCRGGDNRSAIWSGGVDGVQPPANSSKQRAIWIAPLGGDCLWNNCLPSVHNPCFRPLVLPPVMHRGNSLCMLCRGGGWNALRIVASMNWSESGRLVDLVCLCIVPCVGIVARMWISRRQSSLNRSSWCVKTSKQPNRGDFHESNSGRAEGR